MSRRWRIVAWTITCLALAGILFWAYRRFVLLHPDPTLSWIRNGVTYELLNPKMLGAVLIAPWFVAVLSQSLADLPWPQRVISVLLRIAFVALLALGLSRLARTATTEKTCTVYLVDVSDSVTDESLADARTAFEQAWKEKPKDSVIELVTFAERPRAVPAGEAEGGEVKPPQIQRHREEAAKGVKEFGAGSNLQAALQLAYGLYPQGYLKRAVLFSDGVQTEGDVLAEARRAGAAVVHCSSIAAIGAAAGPASESTPFTEDMDRHLYITTKIASEFACRDYLNLFDRPFTVLRYGIPYGPRMRETTVMSAVMVTNICTRRCRVALTGAETSPVWRSGASRARIDTSERPGMKRESASPSSSLTEVPKSLAAAGFPNTRTPSRWTQMASG